MAETNTILYSEPGKVKAITLEGNMSSISTTESTVSIVGFDLDTPGQGSLRPVVITQAAVSQKVASHIMPTLSDKVYVYVLGDQLGAIQLSGVAFHDMYGESNISSGFTALMDYFHNIKPQVSIFGARTAVTVNIDGYAFAAVLSGLNASMNAEKLTQFQMNFTTIPGYIA